MTANGHRFYLIFFLSLSMALLRCSAPNKSAPTWQCVLWVLLGGLVSLLIVLTQSDSFNNIGLLWFH